MLETKTEKEFDREMKLVYENAKTECNYIATRYLLMLNEYGGLNTAKRLLHGDKLSDGFIKLWECGRPDLTVEVLVIKPKYKSLFTEDEIKKAKRRLGK